MVHEMGSRQAGRVHIWCGPISTVRNASRSRACANKRLISNVPKKWPRKRSLQTALVRNLFALSVEAYSSNGLKQTSLRIHES